MLRQLAFKPESQIKHKKNTRKAPLEVMTKKLQAH